MSKVLVIVVTYNGMKWLDRCLGSVCGEDLFVVDNDSTDGSADYVQGHFPAAKLVRSAENLGFSKANNLGFQYALDHGYDYAYLLNQDAWLEEGALEKLVAAAEAHPEYAVLSPLQMTDGYKDYDEQFKKILRSAQNDNSVKRVMAAHWLVRMKAVEKVGLFNETLFPLYGQDDDWCTRARYHGYKIGVVPEARAVHDRALRKEAKEKVIDRNYRVGSLVRLCDINRPLWERFLFVMTFTLVKTVKYVSFLPLVRFISICKALPIVRECRRHAI
ncbi:MAG: glycosyltransferase family 2 protein [Bacteroidales bacterium]|nr:glycosyltransferase family 2 protein [Bacteroidales bacterium]